jgi:hypothetical protein
MRARLLSLSSQTGRFGTFFSSTTSLCFLSNRAGTFQCTRLKIISTRMKAGAGMSEAESLVPPYHGGEGGLARFGLPELPGRCPPRSQRKLYAVSRAKKDIDLYGRDALAEARERLMQLTALGTNTDEIREAQQIVHFMTHSRGPKFQVAMLIHCEYRKIECIWSKDQSPYERVYELSMAVTTGIYAQTAIAIRKATAALETPLIS